MKLYPIGSQIDSGLFTQALNYLPMLGRIAAGIPIDAIEDSNREELLALLTTPGRYALRVCGDSMIEAGIFDGDSIIVQSLQQATNGDIVVALIDHETVTLKRIKHLSDGRIRLIADNSAIPSQVYEAKRITIQGKVVGQIRQFS
jgi:repressor LexA